MPRLRFPTRAPHRRNKSISGRHLLDRDAASGSGGGAAPPISIDFFSFARADGKNNAKRATRRRRRQPQRRRRGRKTYVRSVRSAVAEGGAARRAPAVVAVARATICPDAKKNRLKGISGQNGPAASQSHRLDRQPPEITAWTTEWVGPTHSWVAAGVFRRSRQLVPPIPLIPTASH